MVGSASGDHPGGDCRWDTYGCDGRRRSGYQAAVYDSNHAFDRHSDGNAGIYFYLCRHMVGGVSDLPPGAELAVRTEEERIYE